MGSRWSIFRMPNASTFQVIATIIAVITLSGALVFSSLRSGQYVNFYPINGTFQNFNPVRRFLSGQIPYTDFVDYLGFGHLYMGSLLTWILGGNYQASLVAFSAMSSFSAIILLVAVGHFITGRVDLSVCVTAFLVVASVTQAIMFGEQFEIVHQSAQYAWGGGGNSARFIRGFVMPLTSILLIVLIRYNEKVKNAQHEILSRTFWVLAISEIASLGFLWSNDYGVCTWICLLLMSAIVVSARRQSIAKGVIWLAICGICSVGLVIVNATILTWGHPADWLKMTFGTGGYQSWYYNSPKAYYLYDIDMHPATIVQGIVALVYVILLVKRQADAKALVRFGLPGFMNLVCFAAVQEYRLLSGGRLPEVAVFTLLGTTVFEVVSLVSVVEWKSVSAILGLSASVAAVMFVPWAVSISHFIEASKDGVWVDSLGGKMTTLSQSLADADEFLGGNRFFATYASAQEVYSNTFQPSGTDYIIHVLGDSQRDAYLQSFSNGGFTYAATMNPMFTGGYEYWCERANWFWYRDLYANWIPIFANEYEVFWRRSTAKRTCVSAKVETVVVDDHTVEIVVEADQAIDGVADVLIRWKTAEGGGLSQLLTLRRLILVADSSAIPESKDRDYNYLRGEGEEYIPVRIVNGRGSVVITSQPQNKTFLEVEAATCDRVFTVMYEYVPCTSVSRDGERVSLYVPYSTERLEAVQSASRISTAVGDLAIDSVQIDETAAGEKKIILVVNLGPEINLAVAGGYMLHLLP